MVDESGNAQRGVLLDVRGVSKTFAATQALDDVSFAVAEGSVHALLGGNGSGKSTLIKLLAGVHQGDAGSFVLRGDAHDAQHTSPAWAHEQGLRFVHQAVGTFPDLTVAENFALGSSFGTRSLGRVSWRGLHREVAKTLARFKVDVSPKAPMSSLSPAMRTMVAVARAAVDQDADRAGLFVLDEPTATLPPGEVDVLLDAVASWRAEGHTVILVTHRLDEVLRVADTATFLRDGRHLETSAVADLDERAMARRIAGIDTQLADRTIRTDERPVRLVLEDLEGAGLHGASLEAREGEVLGLAGLVGCGASELLRSVFGADPVSQGSMTLGDSTYRPRGPHQAVSRGVAYVPADRLQDAAFLDRTVAENLSAVAPGDHWRGWRLSRTKEKDDAARVAQQFGVVAESPGALFSSLSGGNQQKVVIARWLERKPKLLLLDEPTQGVDVGARAAIHRFVREAADRGTTVLVASSDHRELAELCDRVVGVHRGRIRGEATGTELTPSRCLELAHGLNGASHDHAE